MRMRPVILESPYAATTDDGIRENIDYARRCVRDSLSRGEAPIASHLLFTQPGILDDTVPEERQLGLDAASAWRFLAEITVVYIDRGISDGMQRAIDAALKSGTSVQLRKLGEEGALQLSPLKRTQH